MPTPTVIFAHGRDAGPWGVKIRRLARVAESFGCSVSSQDDRDNSDPDARVEHLVASAREVERPLILVGSSMGGYVVTVASELLKPRGLFLMAPAIGLPGYKVVAPVPDAEHVDVVHGWDDDVVPAANVLDFASRHKLFCQMVPAGHTLGEQLPWLEQVFGHFLRRTLGHDQQDSGRQLAALI